MLSSSAELSPATRTPYLPNGEYITSSRIQNINFVDNTIETLNTVYEVEDEMKLGVE